MNPNPISPDDPRLTAFALDEMESTEREDFSRLLHGDPAAQAAVEEIRAAARVLGAALQAEPAPAPAIDVRTILSGAAAPRPEATMEPTRAKILRFPSLYFVVSGLAAACFAVFFVLHEARQPAAKPTVVAEMKARNEAAPMVEDSSASSDRAGKAASSLLPLTAAESAVDDRFFPVAEATSSTFPLRVGRESYDAVRALLRRGLRPARATVHVAELVNAFQYTWPEPAPADSFSTVLEETEAPWAPGHRLVRVGLKARADQSRTLADDARVEVDFNPARVAAWRLVGFERDGNSAGVRGAGGETLRPGDAVTVLYELVPVAAVAPDADPNLLRLALRYREPESGDSRLFESTLVAGTHHFADASPDMKFATAVAAFGLQLRDSTMQAPVPLPEVERWARAGAGAPDRVEFVEVVEAAEKVLR